MNEITTFRHLTPPFRTFCGTGSLSRLSGELDRGRCQRTVVLSGKSIHQFDDVTSRLEVLLGSRLAGWFDGVEAHSSLSSVELARDALVRARADSVIALGGGSAIVTARAATILVAEKRSVRELCTYRTPEGELVSPKLLAPKLPIYVIPSTPTTAYAKAGSAVRDPQTGERLALYDPKTRASALFLDPMIAATAPISLSFASALNAFSMTIESIQGNADDPLTEGLLTCALRIFSRSLPKAISSPDELPVRIQLMIGALLAGQASDYTGGGLAQTLAHAAGPRSMVSNGIVEAILLPHAVRFNAPVTQGRLAVVANELGGTRLEPECDESAIVSDFLAELKLPSRLRDVGVAKESIDEIADHAMDDWTLSRVPRPVQKRDITELLQAAW